MTKQGWAMLVTLIFFIVGGGWLSVYIDRWRHTPIKQPTVTVYIHDTTIVRDIIIPCRLQPVKHDTVIIHVKD